MQIFELYFNPKKENYIAEAFNYKPKDAYEAKIGRIYLLGEITAPEKKDAPLLQNIFYSLREDFYKDPSIPPEKALQSSLLGINRIIKENKKKENLNVAIIASKNFSIFASKIGNVKIFLISRGKVIDIGKEVEDGEFNLFGSIIVEKMKKKDKLIILSSEIYSFFVKNKILEKIANESLGENIANKISAMHKEQSPEIFGTAIIIDHTTSIKEDGEKTISEEEKQQFSFRKIVQKSFPLLFAKKKKKRKNKDEKESIKFKPKPPLTLKKTTPFSIKNNQKKAVLLVLSLVFIVAIGSIIIGIEKNLRIKGDTEEIELLKEKIISTTAREDFSEMKELFEEIDAIKKNPLIFTSDIKQLYNDLREKLLDLSLSETTEDVMIVKKLERINPDTIAYFNSKLYFTSQKETSLSTLNLTNHSEEIYDVNIEEGVTLITSSSNGVLLFSPPHHLIRARNSTISVEKINLPGEENKFISISSFLGRPYFLDDKGEVFTYTSNNPTRWMEDNTKRAENGRSLTIDGSIYVITNNSQILHYYRGEKEKTIDLSIFPKLENPNKIITTPESPLLILDTENERIIIVSKEGKLVKQIFHKKFKNIKDITLSSNGKKIYLLIGKEVYSLDL